MTSPLPWPGVMGGKIPKSMTAPRLCAGGGLFDAAVIRRSARSQGLRTEASARYERGVNPAELELACNRALALCKPLAGAQVMAQTTGRTALGEAIPERIIPLRLPRVAQVLGPVTNLGETPQALPPDTSSKCSPPWAARFLRQSKTRSGT
jgi:phenylalanyl-tRNA synthetase beta chain